jgi:hypothetical protein
MKYCRARKKEHRILKIEARDGDLFRDFVNSWHDLSTSRLTILCYEIYGCLVEQIE